MTTGDLRAAKRGRRGHCPVRHRRGDWRCSCGVPLSGGPYGNGRRGARDVMRFHVMDLWLAEQPVVAEVSSDGHQ